MMIADCLSRIVCQNTAEDDETLNLHVTALMMSQDGKLQDIHHQSNRSTTGEISQSYRMVGVKAMETWMQIYMHSRYTDSTCTSLMASL